VEIHNLPLLEELSLIKPSHPPKEERWAGTICQKELKKYIYLEVGGGRNWYHAKKKIRGGFNQKK